MVDRCGLLPNLGPTMLTDLGKRATFEKGICKSNASSSSLSYSSTRSSSSNNSDESERISYKEKSDKKSDCKSSKDCILFLDLNKQLVPNSSLVKHRASDAKNSLVAASLTTGATLPLMVGSHPDEGDFKARNLTSLNLSKMEQINNNNNNNFASQNLIPKNTAQRAEQRRQSVVKPTIKVNPNQDVTSRNKNNNNAKLSTRLEASNLWPNGQLIGSNQLKDGSNVLEDWIKLHEKLNLTFNTQYTNNNHQTIDYQNLTNQLGLMHLTQTGNTNGCLMKQHLMSYRREQMELDKNVRRQHQFILFKINERRHNLELILAIWIQGDIKRAIAKLVDIYNQGLMFTNPGESIGAKQTSEMMLNSLNTSLVVDVIGIMVHRPKIWNLDICLMLMPIIVNDLLVQKDYINYQRYIEVGLRAIKLITVHFSQLLISTLDGQSDESAKFVGVDLSRETRVSKCKDVMRLLLEARSLASRFKLEQRLGPRLVGLFNDLDKSLSFLPGKLEQ